MFTCTRNLITVREMQVYVSAQVYTYVRVAQYNSYATQHKQVHYTYNELVALDGVERTSQKKKHLLKEWAMIWRGTTTQLQLPYPPSAMPGECLHRVETTT